MLWLLDLQSIRAANDVNHKQLGLGLYIPLKTKDAWGAPTLNPKPLNRDGLDHCVAVLSKLSSSCHGDGDAP